MITYNHERYIEQAVRSVLSQRVNFPYEIVIGEDCSTDRTREILVALQQQHPDRIRLLEHSHNLGMLPNFVATQQACRGKYVALLEGDDYWVDDTKLQQQVDFLEAHPECSICHTNAFRVIGDQSPASAESMHVMPPPQPMSLGHLLSGHMCVTCTTMYRNRLFDEFPDWFTAGYSGDWTLQLLNLRYGVAGYLDQPMGAYRIHPQSNWSSMDRREQLRRMIVTIELARPIVPAALQPQLDRMIELRHVDMLEQMFRDGENDEARNYAQAHLVHRSGYHRLRYFFDGLQEESQGHRGRALWRLTQSLVTGSGRTRIRSFDILLAMGRCGCPSLYRLIRSIRNRRGSAASDG
jgi:glycosyltransferase involved in cell wall biosynthesis